MPLPSSTTLDGGRITLFTFGRFLLLRRWIGVGCMALHTDSVGSLLPTVYIWNIFLAPFYTHHVAIYHSTYD
jgi:hypothetical protein